jgi:hypothetical protein
VESYLKHEVHLIALFFSAIFVTFLPLIVVKPVRFEEQRVSEKLSHLIQITQHFCIVDLSL